MSNSSDHLISVVHKQMIKWIINVVHFDNRKKTLTAMFINSNSCSAVGITIDIN